MELSNCLPVWQKLTTEQQNRLSASAYCRKVNKGEVIHSGKHGMYRTSIGAVRTASGLYDFR